MKQLTAIILTALIWACGAQPQNDSRALELSDTKIIKITYDTPHPIRADNARIIGMDEMLDRVKSIDYIKLDSSEPIGVIDKMIVTKDKIYILDCYTAQQIFVFDKTGNLLFRIKNKGRGPKEYLSVADMQVDTIRNEILVNDDNENWAILVSDKDSVLYKGFTPTPLQDNNFAVNSFTYDCDGKLLFTPVYSDTVYQFMSVSIVSPKYVIHQKKSIWNLYNQKIPPLEVDKLIKQNNYTRYAGKFLDGGNYASFEIAHKWEEYITPRPYFWDKRTDIVFAWDTANVDEDAIVHEIIRQPIAVYGDTFFGTCSPQIPEEYRKNLSPKIKSLLECSKESDNPIVVAYTLK